MAKKKIKILVSVGHSILKNGACTSADGRPYGGVLEYKYCKDFARLYLVPQLKKAGHEVDLLICPEKKFSTYKEEKPYKMAIEHSKKYDLAMELHLNSAQPSANGSEVYYKTKAGKEYAEKIAKALGEVYRDRGAKQTDGLYWLNDTRATAVLVELFFCTNKSDYKKGHGRKNATKLAKLIAGAI